jgi:large subunit ribosomal protein L17
MRHMKRGRKLGRTASHRKAMLANLAASILEHERVVTTVEKAKEGRRLVERLVSYGRKGTLNAVRMAERYIKNKTLLRKLFSDIAVRYKDRIGGYVRIIKTSERKGDCATMCIIELVDRPKAEAVAVEPAAGGRKKKAAPAQKAEAGSAEDAPGKKAKRAAKPKEEGEAPAKKKPAKRGKAKEDSE